MSPAPTSMLPSCVATVSPVRVPWRCTGATTLILVDGHRLAPVGTDQSSLDPDVIPMNVMRRVEVVTNGGSSLYGADAVGGVINFVTLDDYDGVRVDLGYDTGDDCDGWQAASSSSRTSCG